MDKIISNDLLLRMSQGTLEVIQTHLINGENSQALSLASKAIVKLNESIGQIHSPEKINFL